MNPRDIAGERKKKKKKKKYHYTKFEAVNSVNVAMHDKMFWCSQQFHITLSYSIPNEVIAFPIRSIELKLSKELKEQEFFSVIS